MPKYDRKYGYANRQAAGEYGLRARPARRKVPPKRLFTALALVLCTGVAATVMYFSDLTEPIVNAFSAGSIQVEIQEPGVDPGAVQWGTNTKPVKLYNPEDSIAGVVRAKLMPPAVYDTSGNAVAVDTGTLSAPSGNTLVMGEFTLHLADGWQNNWFYKDGWFYYNKILQPGETTTQLLAGVTLTDPDKAESYKSYTVKVDVLADILQTEGNAPTTEWGVTVGGDGAVSA